MVKKGKRQGFLIVVLIMSLLFFIIAVAICSYLGVQYSIMGESENSLRALYAADSGVQYALGLIALQNSSAGRYFGYLNLSGTTFRSFSSATVTLYDAAGAAGNYTNATNAMAIKPVRPMPQEVFGQSAKDYLYTLGTWTVDTVNKQVYSDFAWKLLWDDGISTVVYFTVVRATQFPNKAGITSTTGILAGSNWNPNSTTLESDNEQISPTGLAYSLYSPPCWDQYLYGSYTSSACANADKGTRSHIHCRYTIKSIGEVWAYHGASTSKTMDRVLARRTVMAEIGTVMPIDKQFVEPGPPPTRQVKNVSAGQILKWYEVYR